jgi:hypothetical protein
MARETTYAGLLGSTTALTTALAANAADLPHLELTRTKLDQLLTDTAATVKQQHAVAATKQELSKTLKKQITEGQRLTTALQKLLKENYGIDSEKLVEFGMQPFRGRKPKVVPPQVEVKTPPLTVTPTITTTPTPAPAATPHP